MSIDWVTVLAQLANFLLLVWLLKRFLYRPILAGIDAREAEIARRMSAADEAREQARAAEQEYQRLREKLSAIREEKVAEALRATEHEREQLLAEARAQREQEHRDWRRHLEREREEFVQRLQRAGATTLLELTRKALHELAGESLEAAIARQLGQRLTPMAAELGAAAGPVRQATVSTQQPLPAEAQAHLTAELKRALPGAEPRFVVDAEQSPGVIIQAGGARLDWTIASYMDEFNAALTRAHPAATTALQPEHEQRR
ncbi:MAG: F0F1 ATP synthase subunit delta [Ottowia sp.]|nr:F0F1 ATP synthase subunit delta [Ottowia sp.]